MNQSSLAQNHRLQVHMLATFSSADFQLKINLFIRNTIRVSISLDPDLSSIYVQMALADKDEIDMCTAVNTFIEK